jgi:hypothetical protein
MLYRRHEPSRIRNVILGGIVIAVFLAIINVSPEAIKLAGALFLYIPDKLGLIEQVASEDTHIIHLASDMTLLEITESGRYAMYTADTYLLRATLNTKIPWLVMTAQATGEQIAVSVVERGLRPYDTPVAKGRPIFTFEIETPGVYEISHPVRETSPIISIVPDYTTGQEATITLAYLLQIALIVVLASIPYYLRKQPKRDLIEALQQQKRDQSDAFWQARTQERNKD